MRTCYERDRRFRPIVTVCNLLYNAFLFQFAMVEAIISAIADEFPRVMRPHKSKLTFVVCLALFLLGLPIVTYVSSSQF